MEQILKQVRTDENWLAIQVFLYLQLLDLLTTLVGLKLGAGEASPFVRLLIQAGPTAGVLLSKMVALSLGAACVALHRVHLIRWICYWYAGLVVWNLFVILSKAAN
jgi:hypothetical protein